jgi:hypothetical protein
MMYRFAWLLILVFASLFMVAQAAAVEPVGELVPVQYIGTADGDTIVVIDHQGQLLRVRLLSVNAPELDEGTSAAFQSALSLCEIMEAALAVYIEHDNAALFDQYGQPMAWVWVDSAWDTGVQAPELVQLRLLAGENRSLYSACPSTRYAAILQQAILIGTPTPDYTSLEQQPKPEYPVLEPSIEITDFGWMWGLPRSNYVDCSWRVEITNRSQRNIEVTIQVQLLNDGGYELEEGYMFDAVVRPGVHGFTDEFMVEVAVANQISYAQASIED